MAAGDISLTMSIPATASAVKVGDAVTTGAPVPAVVSGTTAAPTVGKVSTP